MMPKQSLGAKLRQCGSHNGPAVVPLKSRPRVSGLSVSFSMMATLSRSISDDSYHALVIPRAEGLR